MLVGQALLDFVRERPDLTTSDLAKEAGYTRTTKTGRPQVLVKRFLAALHLAMGSDVLLGKAPGKSPQYQTAVHKSGVILLGKTYSQKFGLKPGDLLDIIVDEDAIRLVPKSSGSLSSNLDKS